MRNNTVGMVTAISVFLRRTLVWNRLWSRKNADWTPFCIALMAPLWSELKTANRTRNTGHGATDTVPMAPLSSGAAIMNFGITASAIVWRLASQP